MKKIIGKMKDVEIYLIQVNGSEKLNIDSKCEVADKRMGIIYRAASFGSLFARNMLFKEFKHDENLLMDLYSTLKIQEDV